MKGSIGTLVVASFLISTPVMAKKKKQQPPIFPDSQAQGGGEAYATCVSSECMSEDDDKKKKKDNGGAGCMAKCAALYGDRVSDDPNAVGGTATVQARSAGATAAAGWSDIPMNLGGPVKR